MAAQRSGSFSRRCGDRNHSWTRNNEEGIQKERANDDRFEGFDGYFFERGFRPESSRENKGEATRRRKWNQGGEEAMESEKNRRNEKRHIYRLPSPMSRASNRMEERRTLPREYRLNLIPVGLRANPSTIQPSFLEPSWRRGIPDFPPVSEKGDDASVCDSGICRRSNLRGRRVASVQQNC